MGDARYGVSLIEADGGKQCARGHEQNPLPLTALQIFQNIRCQRNRRASAAASAGMGILLLFIVDLNPAVHMPPCDVIPPLLQKIDEGCLPHISQISCDDLVIIIRPDPKVFKILRYGVGSSRGFCPFWTIWADAASAMHSSAFFSS